MIARLRAWWRGLTADPGAHRMFGSDWDAGELKPLPACPPWHAEAKPWKPAPSMLPLERPGQARRTPGANPPVPVEMPQQVALPPNLPRVWPGLITAFGSLGYVVVFLTAPPGDLALALESDRALTARGLLA